MRQSSPDFFAGHLIWPGKRLFECNLAIFCGCRSILKHFQRRTVWPTPKRLGMPIASIVCTVKFRFCHSGRQHEGIII
jgi:hypothetical protein